MSYETTIARSKTGLNARVKMKIQKLFINRSPQFFLLLLAGMILLPGLRAQTPPPPPEKRVLLIFDTSASMKKRLPAEARAIKRLFGLSLAEQLEPGDSIGVWTFNQDVHMGNYPLQHWQVQDITAITANILDFVQTQHYSKTTSFDKLVPLINRVVGNSPRLLVVIFCDGEGQMSGTPFDSSVNAIFQQHAADMRKAREPIVIAFRVQSGQYTGSTINSAENINLPSFPQPSAPPPPSAPAPVIAPQVPAPPPNLIIIGTNAGAKAPPPPPPPEVIIKETVPALVPANPPKTNSLPQTSALPKTNAVLAVAVPAQPANVAVAPSAITTPPIEQTQTTAVVIESPPISKRAVLGIGFGVIIFAGVSVYLLSWLSRRRGSASLITESLKKR
jgi:hypothetical protein